MHISAHVRSFRTCPSDSEYHIEATRSRKQNKTQYLQLLAEFDCLRTIVEISVIGHYQRAQFHQSFLTSINHQPPSLPSTDFR